jgi:hypothetical protein
VVARIDRIASRSALTAAETEDVAIILKGLCRRVDALTAEVIQLKAAQAAPAKPPAAVPASQAIIAQPAAKPASKPRERRRIVLGRMTRQQAEQRIVDTLRTANGASVDSVRKLATAAGTKRTTTASVLAGLLAAGIVGKVATGFVLLA